MTEEQYQAFWRVQGPDHMPSPPVPLDLIEEEMRRGGYE